MDLKARAEDFTVIDELRYRTISAVPRLPDTRRFAAKHSMLHAVPTLFWPEWAFRLDTEDLPWLTSRQVMSRLLLTIGSVMSRHELERQLHSTVDRQRTTEAATDLRNHPNWEEITTALMRLHEHLGAHPPPIDYQRRRDLRYAGLLPDGLWKDLVAQEGFSTTPRMAAAARLWLIERISGAPAPNPGCAVSCRGAYLDRVRRILTPELAHTLNTVATDDLQAQGITGEPITWAPPIALLEGLNLPGSSPDAVDPKIVHELLLAGLTVPGIGRKLEASVWKVRHQLEQHPLPRCVSPSKSPRLKRAGLQSGAFERAKALLPEKKLRDLHERRGLTFAQIADRLGLQDDPRYLSQVVSDVAGEYGIFSRRALMRGRITKEWIYEQHVVRRRTLRALAEEVGVNDMTIGYWARKYGIQTHRWERRPLPDRRAVLLLEELALEPAAVPAALTYAFAWTRAQRFTVAADYDNFARAAEALGCGKDTLSKQIGRLESYFGQKLLERAGSRQQPMIVTPFGKKLARA